MGGWFRLVYGRKRYLFLEIPEIAATRKSLVRLAGPAFYLVYGLPKTPGSVNQRTSRARFLRGGARRYLRLVVPQLPVWFDCEDCIATGRTAGSMRVVETSVGYDAKDIERPGRKGDIAVELGVLDDMEGDLGCRPGCQGPCS